MLGRPGGCALRFGFCLELLRSRFVGLPGVPLQGERVLGFFVVFVQQSPLDSHSNNSPTEFQSATGEGTRV